MCSRCEAATKGMNQFGGYCKLGHRWLSVGWWLGLYDCRHQDDCGCATCEAYR